METTNNIITYSYTIESIANDVFMKTSYYASNYYSDKGDDLSESFILYVSESNMLAKLLDGILGKIQLVFSGLTDGVENAIRTDNGSLLLVNIKPAGPFDMNIAIAIEAALYDMIIKQISYLFYIHKNNEALIKISGADAANSVEELVLLVSKIKRGRFNSLLG